MEQYYKVDSEREVIIERIDVLSVAKSRRFIKIKSVCGFTFTRQEVGKDAENNLGGSKYFETLKEACNYLLEIEKK